MSEEIRQIARRLREIREVSGYSPEEVAARLARNYPADIKAFDQVEQEALSMADYFSSGIMRQFPQRFH